MHTGSKTPRSRSPSVSAKTRASLKAHSITRTMDGLTRAAAVAKTRELGWLAGQVWVDEGFNDPMTDDAGRYMRLAGHAPPTGRRH